MATHEKDYHSLYDRMKLNLGNLTEMPVVTTDSLLKGMDARTNSESENQYLEMLYFQFGRYLLISSSREGSLPANLQGVWGERLSNPWNSDYHTNINVQMNYWPTQPTNLSRCHLPMVEYVKSLVPRGKYTAQQYYCKPDGGNVRGWVTHHEIIFGVIRLRPRKTLPIIFRQELFGCARIFGNITSLILTRTF